ncbi:MAG: SUMF1/EgtB/PvdO family nonheme iron enzyme [Anaerolineales bacterium]|nr:SUMF1/EgtB/PvdO family nonheme iron enzyme [Anaerolineales bacterium]
MYEAGSAAGNKPIGADWRGLENHPAADCDWNDAAPYCRWAGRRLPGEVEWEKAVRGTDGRGCPRGINPRTAIRRISPTRTSTWIGRMCKSTTGTGSHPRRASPYGALDKAGNVWE